MKLKKSLATLALTAALAVGVAGTAFAQTFGSRLNGASSVEVMQVKYDGAAWNYSGSGYKNAWFKYTRDGKTLLYRTVSRGKVTGSVWDNLINWNSSQTTKFGWGHSR